MKFKVGDKVVCITNKEYDPTRGFSTNNSTEIPYLKVGRIYTILKIDEDGLYDIDIEKNYTNGFVGDRFRNCRKEKLKRILNGTE
jgi:hypothetical protein